jgi:hypothetical protein
VVRFVENSLLFNRLNISRADIPCVLDLEKDVGETVQSTQPVGPVTLYITINITPPNLSISIEDDNSPAPEHLLALSHHEPAETGNAMSQIEDMSSTSIKNPPFALHQADEAMKRIVPTGRSNTWERAVGRFKWVMDTLSPIAEVCTMPFDVLG